MTQGSSQLTLLKVLNDKFKTMQQKNPSYSLRAFAKKLMISPPALSEIMRGRRQVSHKMLARLTEHLELSSSQKEEILKHAGTMGILPFHKPKKFTELAEDSYKIIAEWYHFGILSLAETADFQGSAPWIAERLNISLDTASAALDRLVGAGLLVRSPDGSLTVTGKSFSTTDEVSSEAIMKAHCQNLELAKNSLQRDELSKRDFRAATLAISPEKLKDAKMLINEFIDRLMTFLEDGKKEEVYKVCVQLFPLSVPPPKKVASLLQAIAIFCMLLIPNKGFAGHKENNGGGVIFCPNANPSTRLLDIWEAGRLKGLNFNLLTVDVSANLAKIQLSNPELFNALHEMSRVIANPEKIIDIPRDLQIEPPFDARNGFMKVGCTLRGMGMYDDAAGVLYLDRLIYNKLPYLDAKAFLIHESAYKVFRQWYNADTSIGARRFVGCLFSSDSCPDLDPNADRPQVGANTWRCQSTELAAERPVPEFEFLVTAKPEGGSRLHLLSAWGHPPSAKSILEFNSLSPFLGGTVEDQASSPVRLLSTGRLGKTSATFQTKVGQDIDVVFSSQPITNPRTNSTGWGVTIDGSPVVCTQP